MKKSLRRADACGYRAGDEWNTRKPPRRTVHRPESDSPSPDHRNPGPQSPVDLHTPSTARAPATTWAQKNLPALLEPSGTPLELWRQGCHLHIPDRETIQQVLLSSSGLP